MLHEFKIYSPIQFGIFLKFATIKIAGETKQQNLISARIEYLEPHYLHSRLFFSDKPTVVFREKKSSSASFFLPGINLPADRIHFPVNRSHYIFQGSFS